MEELIRYFIKVMLLQSILFGAFLGLNRKGTNFHFNRYFLLATLLLPLIIPYATIPISLPADAPMSIDVLFPPSFVNESISNNPIPKIETQVANFNYWMLTIPAFYITVAIFSAITMINTCKRIIHLTRKSNKKEITPNGFHLFHVESDVVSFSFLNKIFLSNKFPLTPQEKDIIIAHEEYHISHGHSLDILISEIVRIIFWINPLLGFLQKKLKENHEYLADKNTLKISGHAQYVKLLKEYKWHEMHIQLVHAYSGSNIKNRLDMIQMHPKPSKLSGIAALCMISVLTIFLFACENDMSELQGSSTSFDENQPNLSLEEEINRSVKAMGYYPQDVIDAYISLQRSDPTHRYIHGISIEKSNTIKPNPEDPKNKSMLPGLNDDALVYSRKFTEDENKTLNRNKSFQGGDQFTAYVVIYKVNRLEYEAYHKGNHNDNEIHEDYDKAATFKGGKATLEKTLKENLRYPESAKARAIEDQVFVSFVINKAGHFVYLNIAKEPSVKDEDLRIEFMKAAFAAVKATEGQWNPAEKDGRYVYSRMTLPIEFKLDNK